MTNYIKAILAIFISCGTITVSAQQTTRTSPTEVQNDKPCFGGLESGFISISDALNDSLAFSDSLLNTRMHIVSFNLALKCNGNTIKYMENKSGNKLTPEMKEAIQKLHQNCTLNFDGIISRSNTKDMSGKFTATKHKGFKLTVQ